MITDIQAGLEVYHLRLSCKRFERDLAKETGLTINEIDCVLSLYTEDIKSVGNLSRFLDLSFTSTSKILSSLEEKGIIRRSIDSRDRRVEKVSLTPLGRGIAERVLIRSREITLQMLKMLPENVRNDFAKWARWFTVENQEQSN
ncbi:MAG: MarR family transcriptional regulator [Candidatus Kryptoniota bacterium]